MIFDFLINININNLIIINKCSEIRELDIFTENWTILQRIGHYYRDFNFLTEINITLTLALTNDKELAIFYSLCFTENLTFSQRF